MVNGKPYKQQKLTLRQSQEIFEVLFDVGVADLDSLMNEKLSTVIKILFNSGVLAKLILVLLIPQEGSPALTEEDILDLDTDSIEEVVMNFLSLNPRLMSLLKGFVKPLAGMSATSISPNS